MVSAWYSLTHYFSMISDARLYDCIFMAYHDTSYFYFELNLIITQLEHIVDRVMVPLKCFPVQPHLPLWEGLYLVRCHAFGWCLQRGKVMAVQYPGPKSRHNLVCPLVLLWYLVPIWDRWLFCHDCGRWMPLVYIGATHDLAQEGSLSKWLGECDGNRVVLSECHGSTEMGVRGLGFCGVGTVY